MESRLKRFLEKLAMTRGQGTYGPEGNSEEDLRSFQEEIDEIEKLAGTEMLTIIGKPHRESRTGKRYIDRIRLEVTAEGIAWMQKTEPTNGTRSLTRAQSAEEQIAKLREDFDGNVLSPLRSDLRVKGLQAYEFWKRDFIAFLEQQLPHEVSRFRRLSFSSNANGQAQKENAYNRFMREEGKTCLDFLQSIAEERSAAATSVRVFLSYAREDVAEAVRLYEELSAKGLDVWLDKESLLPGQNWKSTIRREIRERRYFIAVLSHKSLSKRGYVQKELKEALDVLEEYPASSVFIIPARLDDCTPSDERLRDLHWVNMFDNWDLGVERILKTIGDSQH